MKTRVLPAVVTCLVVTQCAERPPSPAPEAPVRGGPFYDVRDYGAVADGRTKSTEAIRKAIDAAARAGGGTVIFPAGEYVTGPIHLKSNLTLWLEAGAVVKFSTDFGDYLPMVRSQWEGTEVTNFSPLVYGDKVENVAIHGRGVLDGQGEAWWNQYRTLRAERKKTGVWATVTPGQKEFFRLNSRLEMPDDPDRLKSGFLRPPLIQLLDSRNISLRDITLKNSPFWTINPVNCEELTVSGISILNPPEAPNTDGINPESCRNVHISDCHISVGDDCITIKSGRDAEARRRGHAAENYTITNSTMLRGHGGVVIGSEMSGSVRNIAISNCVFDGTDRGIRIKSNRGRGGVVEDVRVNNVVMRSVREEAITLSLFYRPVPPEPFSERTPRFRRIHLGGITGTAAQAGSLLGLEESPLEDISLTDVSLIAKRGIVIQDAKHVELRSVRVDTEAGPAVAAERTYHLELIDVDTRTPHPDAPTVRLSNVKQASLRGAFVAPGTEVFLQVQGEQTEGLVVEGIDFASVKTPIEVLPGVPAGALVSAVPTARVRAAGQKR